MNYNEEQKGNYYIIADHLRTTIFALADGAIFEPKGRGYILKKLVKKAILLAYLVGLDSKQLQEVSEKIIEVNSTYYPYLSEKKILIISELNKEIDKEISFIQKAEKELEKNYSPPIAAETIFFWYDTKGIPLALIYAYLKNKQCEFPEKEFKSLLAEKKKRSQKDRTKKKISAF